MFNNMRKILKKIGFISLLFLLNGCVSYIGNVNERHLIIVNCHVLNGSDMTEYRAWSYKGNSYTNGIIFVDKKGKYNVGDTLILTLK